MVHGNETHCERGEPGKMMILKMYFALQCLECKYYAGIDTEKPCKSDTPCLGDSAFDFLRKTLVRKSTSSRGKELHTPMK